MPNWLVILLFVGLLFILITIYQPVETLNPVDGIAVVALNLTGDMNSGLRERREKRDHPIYIPPWEQY